MPRLFYGLRSSTVGGRNTFIMQVIAYEIFQEIEREKNGSGG